MKNKLTVATVFSGIGAFEFALRRLGIEHDVLFACDNGERIVDYSQDEELKKIRSLGSTLEKKVYVENLYASKTNKKNFVETSYLANYEIKDNLFYQDVRLLDGTDFKDKVDIFVGGSPCQSFSSVGFQAGLEDTRGTLFYEYARLIKEIEPKVFIYENVRNLLNHDKGKTWKVIQEVFNSLGYSYSYFVLNSKDYGIPQNRRRLFVVGFKKDTKFSEPHQIALKYKMQDFLIEQNSFGSISFDKNGELTFKNLGGVIEEKYFLTPLLYKYVMKGGTKTFYQNPVIDLEIARTLLSTMGNRHRAGIDNYVTINGRVRMLSEREAHRLMGFTDDYKIVVSRAQAYKQAGNSIVVDVLMNIIKEIIKTKVFE